MLPTRLGNASRRGGYGFQSSSALPQYLRRALHYPQMDLEYTFTQMAYLCSLNPSKVYKLTSFRKQTKDQWARDDPGFVAVLTVFLLIAAVAYGIAFRLSTVSTWVWIFVHALVQLHGTGLVVASAGWWIGNKYLRERHTPHSVEQEVEWLYAFDIHCNSFFPLFVLLYVVQYVFLMFLLNGSFFACLIGNTLYLLAFTYYFYVTFSGYMILPFLQRTNLFLYPVAGLFLVYIVSLITRWSIPAAVLGLYFE